MQASLSLQFRTQKLRQEDPECLRGALTLSPNKNKVEVNRVWWGRPVTWAVQRAEGGGWQGQGPDSAAGKLEGSVENVNSASWVRTTQGAASPAQRYSTRPECTRYKAPQLKKKMRKKLLLAKQTRQSKIYCMSTFIGDSKRNLLSRYRKEIMAAESWRTGNDGEWEQEVFWGDNAL